MICDLFWVCLNFEQAHWQFQKLSFVQKKTALSCLQYWLQKQPCWAELQQNNSKLSMSQHITKSKSGQKSKLCSSILVSTVWVHLTTHDLLLSALVEWTMQDATCWSFFSAPTHYTPGSQPFWCPAPCILTSACCSEMKVKKRAVIVFGFWTVCEYEKYGVMLLCYNNLIWK